MAWARPRSSGVGHVIMLVALATVLAGPHPAIAPLSFQRPLPANEVMAETMQASWVEFQGRALTVNAPYSNCSGQRYEAHLALLPHLALRDLLLPPRMNLLFFGHSYIGQLVTNLWLANPISRIENLAFDGASRTYYFRHGTNANREQ